MELEWAVKGLSKLCLAYLLCTLLPSIVALIH